MKPLEMQTLMRKTPFEPFRIYLKDGRVFDVRDPRINLVTELRLIVGRLDAKDPDCGIADGVDYVHWPDIVKVEKLPVLVST